MPKPDPSAILGRMIAHLIPLGLMLWAGLETAGALHWALLGWVAFSFLVYLGVTAVRAEEKK